MRFLMSAALLHAVQQGFLAHKTVRHCIKSDLQKSQAGQGQGRHTHLWIDAAREALRGLQTEAPGQFDELNTFVFWLLHATGC